MQSGKRLCTAREGPAPFTITPGSAAKLAFSVNPTSTTAGATITPAVAVTVLDAGMVGVNSVLISTPETPFGGVKDSGYGHEGGIEGLEAYMVRKFISQG